MDVQVRTALSVSDW